MVTRKFVLSMFLPVLVLVPAAHAQFVQQGRKLVAIDAVGSSCQGSAVALSADGNTAIVGGNCDGGGGAAWVYVRANGVWSQQGPKLVGSAAVGTAWQGTSVALSADGNTAIVGGFLDHGGVGAAWVYVRTNGVWSQQGTKLVGSGAVGTAWQGTSVALSADGNTAIVGGHIDNFETGAAWVYTRTNGVWTQQGSKLVGTGGVANPAEDQGWSVSLSADGNTAIVGGPVDNGGAGAVWVYVRTNGIWTQQGGKLVGTGGVGGASLQGSSVALSADGNTAIVGAPNDPVGGAAYMYIRSSGTWSQQGGKLVGAGAAGFASQGGSVALSADGNTAVVGGRTDNTNVGAVWVYGRINGAWRQQGGKLIGSGAIGHAIEGTSVALSADGNTAIVGGPLDNDSTGAAWVYARTSMYFSLSAPAVTIAGVPFNFTVTALNPDNSIATGYTGIVHFSSTDPIAALPADSALTNGTSLFGSPFSNGVGIFSATLKNAMSFTQTITATDTVNPSITGTSDPIQVQPTVPTHFFVFGPPSATAGVPFTFNYVPLDQFGNFVPPYPGRVRFTSSDPTAILPPEQTGGAPVFAAILKTVGNQTITVTDTGNPSITGTSNPILVTGNPSTNLARGKTATQSSTLPGYAAGGAAAAVDGSTDGNFFNGSVTHTNFETNPWWQVDLGASSTVTSIVIWNRTDCCGARLNDYWVFVSDTPFAATDTPATLQNRPGTWSSHQTAAPSPSTTIAAGNTHGRYVRLQLTGANYLSLAEVQVLFSPAPEWNQALGKPATQSSTLPGYPTAGANAAVDGNTDGNFFDGSVTHTNLDTEPWWQVDLGATTIIDSVVIYNRTDCCGSRLADYYVFASDVPFSPTDRISTLQGRPGTIWIHQTAAPNPAVAVFLGAFARYVRVQVPGSNYLSLAEVQVAGRPNLAQGKAATQSSTLPGYPTAGAAAAVDGSTDGNFFDGSVTHTDLDPNAWWQVDLGASANIGQIQVWNRTDCCASRLSDFWIFASDTPFAPSDTPSTLQSRPATWSFHAVGIPVPGPVFGFGPGNVSGRYVRVQLAGTGYLSLAEVQVFGPPIPIP